MGPIHVIKDTLTGIGYRSILNDVMYPHAEENMPLVWRFQHDNDPKHTSKVVTEWLQSNGVSVSKWPAQSPRSESNSSLIYAIEIEWQKISMETLSIV